MLNQLRRNSGVFLRLAELLLFMAVFSFWASFPALAEEVSPCLVDVDTMPIQIVGGSGHGDVSTLSATKVINTPPGFSGFVTTVTEHLEARLTQEKLCLNSAESRERSLLQFVPMRASVTKSYPLVSVPQLGTQPASLCRLSSPWLDLAIERGPVPQVHAIIRYSERQLLTDQAILAGAQDVPAGIPMPMAFDEFMQYASEYLRVEWPYPLRVPRVAEGVPPDLLWLFRGSSQTDMVPFRNSAFGAKMKAMEKGAEGYTKIVIALIDHCFASDGANIHYDSILGVADLIQIDEYKIATPIR